MRSCQSDAPLTAWSSSSSCRTTSCQRCVIRDPGVTVTTWLHYKVLQGSTSREPEEQTPKGRSAFGSARPTPTGRRPDCPRWNNRPSGEGHTLLRHFETSGDQARPVRVCGGRRDCRPRGLVGDLFPANWGTLVTQVLCVLCQFDHVPVEVPVASTPSPRFGSGFM